MEIAKQNEYVNYLYKLLVLTVIYGGVNSCATYAPNYKTATTLEAYPNAKNPLHTFYLIGDAGRSNTKKVTSFFKVLEKELSNASSSSTTLFLGDNSYPVGLPEKSEPGYIVAKNALNSQLNLVKNYPGKSLFIPGNHDWYSNGLEGLKGQQEYIDGYSNNAIEFLPKNGCPINTTEINPNIVLITIDTQWYLTNWNKHPNINANCSIKSRDVFFEQLKRVIKENAHKTTIIAAHHPMFTYGSHGGYFSWKQQLFPLDNNIPLPVLGSVLNLIRKTGGVSNTDLQHKGYRELRKRLITLAQLSEKVILVSGHEHNLQYIFEDKIPQIVSGSGSNEGSAAIRNGSRFSTGQLGYAQLDVFKDGSSWVRFYGVVNNEKELLYQVEVQAPYQTPERQTSLSGLPKTLKTSIYTENEIKKTDVYKEVWGNRYRKAYGTKVRVKVVNLDTLHGGLQATGKQGGTHSRSLELVSKTGQHFVMHALRKNAALYMDALAFQDQSIKGQFENTETADLLMDVNTGAHPYAPFAISVLADAIEIPHTNPILVYVPKQKALKRFSVDFGDELYLLEAVPTDTNSALSFYEKPLEIVNTTTLLRRLRQGEKHILDDKAYLKARLFDMLIGDWDRKSEHWKWAVYPADNGVRLYKPVPLERRHAFSNMGDGWLMKAGTRLIPSLRMLEGFGYGIRSVKGFNNSGYGLDLALLNQADKSIWDDTVRQLQQKITARVIDNALSNFPKELSVATKERIREKLLARRSQLYDVANTYYEILNTFAVIKGTDKADKFEIRFTNDNEVTISGYKMNNGEREYRFYHQKHHKSTTKEIWIYGLDGHDYFEVNGQGPSPIKIRISGGRNQDIYDVPNARRIHIYDHKSTPNDFNAAKKAKIHRTDNYAVNNYEPNRIKNNQNQFLPSIGTNPDDGFRVGFNNTYTINNFVQNPFTQQHNLKASYYYSTNGFDVQYKGEFANLVGGFNLGLDVAFSSSNYSINFFGFGNATQNLEEQFGKQYNRVKMGTIKFFPSLIWHGAHGGYFKGSVFYENVDVQRNGDRFVGQFFNQTNPILKSFVGGMVQYKFKNQNNRAFPTLGMYTDLEIGFKINPAKESQSFTYVIPVVGFDYKLIPDGTLVLASKFKAHFNIGDGFQFYQAATLGGSDGLRGYRNQRFTGKNAYYQNTDLRWNISQINTGLLPLYLGVYGGFDYGKVWVQDSSSDRWNTSYGGGIFIDGAHLFSTRVQFFNSSEGTRVSFGVGFGF